MLDSLAFTLSDSSQTNGLRTVTTVYRSWPRICLSGPQGPASQSWHEDDYCACGPQDDIPSPTFTLVQPYLSDAGFEVWHMDLYRRTAEQASSWYRRCILCLLLSN